jgi:hypothetical protein
MSQLKRTNPDGSYTPLATMSKIEWTELQESKDSLGKRWGKQIITVNSQARVVTRGRQQKRSATKGA